MCLHKFTSAQSAFEDGSSQPAPVQSYHPLQKQSSPVHPFLHFLWHWCSSVSSVRFKSKLFEGQKYPWVLRQVSSTTGSASPVDSAMCAALSAGPHKCQSSGPISSTLRADSSTPHAESRSTIITRDAERPSVSAKSSPVTSMAAGCPGGKTYVISKCALFVTVKDPISLNRVITGTNSFSSIARSLFVSI